MKLVRWLPSLLAGAVCVTLAVPLAHLGDRPLVVLRAAALSARPAAPVVVDAALADFAAHMTPDDVARGVWALADGGDAAGVAALTPDQRAALAPLMRDGQAQRARVSALRAKRQAAESAWLASGAALAAALGPARAQAVAR